MEKTSKETNKETSKDQQQKQKGMETAAKYSEKVRKMPESEIEEYYADIDMSPSTENNEVVSTLSSDEW